MSHFVDVGNSNFNSFRTVDQSTHLIAAIVGNDLFCDFKKYFRFAKQSEIRNAAGQKGRSGYHN
jgi:hypothetical protein